MSTVETDLTRLATDNDFDHILGTAFSSKNDRFTGYDRLSNCSRLTPGNRVTWTRQFEIPSEVAPSAAGQCRLPDFGGRKLSYG